MCRTVGAKFSVAFRAENQYRTGQPFTYIFCNASYTKHITATPDLRDANALSISSGSGTQSLAGMDPKCPPQRRRNLVAHLRTLLCDVLPGGACPAAALVAVRRASNARVEGATPLSMFWSSAQQIPCCPCWQTKKGRPIAIDKMPTARTATPGSISRTATRSRFLSRRWRQWDHNSTDATNSTRTHHARAFGWLLQGTGTTTRDQSRLCPKSLPEDVSSEDSSLEDMPSEDMSSEDMSPEDMSPEDMSSEDSSPEDMSSEDMLARQRHLGSARFHSWFGNDILVP